MKTLKHFIWMGLFLTANLAFSQEIQYTEVERNNPVELTEISNKNLVSFSAKKIKNTIYFKWSAKNECEEGLYILERSIDNKNYEAVAYKLGKAVSIDAPILYCQQVEAKNDITAYFRLSKVYEDGRYYYSEPIDISELYVGR